MKFVVLVAAVAVVAAAAVSALPPTLVSTVAADLRQFRLVDLNPLRAVFDYEQRQIQTPMTPEALGFHTSTMKLTPMSLTPPASLGLNLGQSFDPQAQYEIQQNNQRVQDMQAYMHDPAHWVGPPPN